jgi:hypothetical protein
MPAFPPAPAQALTTLNAATFSKLSEEKQNLNRERDCLVLILAHLRSRGYIGASSEMQIEGGNLLSQYEPADNIDLISLLKISEDYFWTKFGRKAMFTRKMDGTSYEIQGTKLAKSRRASASHRRVLLPIQGELPLQSTSTSQRKIKVSSSESNHPIATDQYPTSSIEAFDSIVTGSSLCIPRGVSDESADDNTTPFLSAAEDTQLLKQFPFSVDSELRALAAAIQRDILQKSPGVGWDDVVELESELCEAYVSNLQDNAHATKVPFIFALFNFRPPLKYLKRAQRTT